MIRHLAAVLLILSCTIVLYAQEDTLQSTVTEFYQVPYFTYGRGLGITSPDSLYQLNIRLRMQNRLAMTFDDSEIAAVEARVARLRLRFDGFVFNPKILYVVQLSFSSGDIDGFVDSQPVNVLRDGVIFYQPNSRWSFGFGQTKLPGNRQRVISSGDLQLPDRSLANALFNLDRDFGVQARYTGRLGNRSILGFRGAISSGEGRNWVVSEGHGLSYTLRTEFLPFGPFTNDGDYFEGDLMREPKPRLSAGVVYNFNDDALRAAGQRGERLYQPKDLQHLIADLIFKYQGWAFEAEFLSRYTDDPLSLSPVNPDEFLVVYKGHGYMAQASYFFRNAFEIVGRYDLVRPDESLLSYRPERLVQYILGASKYLRGHRLKIQGDVALLRKRNLVTNQLAEQWITRFQIELGI